jgi:photoactive yellow protein
MVNVDRLSGQRVFDLTREELDLLPYGVITLDREGTILRYNACEAAFARRTPEGTVGLGFFTDVAPCANVQGFRGRFEEFARGHDSATERFDFSFDFRWGRQDVAITFLRKADYEDINLIVVMRSQPKAEIGEAVEGKGVPLSLVRGPAARPGAAEHSAGARELDYPTAWEIGSPEEAAWRATIHPDDAASTKRIVERAVARRRPYVIEYRVLEPHGPQRIVDEYGSFGFGKDSPGYATIVDVTELWRQERKLLHVARHDALTGLPNRVLLVERIAAATTEAGLEGRVVAVMALAVAHFESVNETAGHGAGDELLRSVAWRLGEGIRAGDTVAHLNGGMFVILLTDLENAASVTVAARRILNGFSAPYTIAERMHQLSASIGISVSPRNGTDAQGLLQAAETALFASLKSGRGGIVWYSTEMQAEIQTGVRTEDDLRAALEREEFVLHYQPIIAIENERVVALEALVRWNHPTRGLVMPNGFIGVAERTGLIGALGAWVLRDACRQTKLWQEQGLELRVCVNVSVAQFRLANFVDLVAAALAETALDPQMLELELTESVMIDGFAEVIETLGRLKQTGVRLSIDDFGTGYSSLSYLKYFPVDTLKIDRTFITDILTDPCDRAIAKAVLTLASELKIDCIAEGVETADQLELVRELGCRMVQGFYFSQPQLPIALRKQLAASLKEKPSE